MNRHTPVVTPAVATTAVTGSSAAEPSGADIGVLTFNIHHAEGTDGILDLERIAAVIRASAADVVALQEVDRHFAERSDWADQAAALAELVGFHLAYGVNIDRDPASPGGPRIQYGTAVLSRHPMTRWANTHLYRSPGEEQRGLLHVEVDVCGAPVHIYNTHLELFSEADRFQQAQQVVELIRDTRPAVLLGDFNASPHSPEIQIILGAGFSDAWVAFDGAEAVTFPADAPNECIDHIFTSRGVTPKRTSVLTGDPTASDHLPVLALLALEPPS
ncbi:endonuclease/exonuclease/phosphatase family protein [Streptomyces californicus]|uniref:endonuclease/exonuclease/phosphatase family protein n=1 Tax=Streptomyces californicus TaxID=67351 RepID=UPI00296FB012|nr:endonuclease/exonuclease/phosphatase family protein [Streptomyces californicus]MDW4901644.1 endonuclease/exonuclease/phosphatase family protein [Streptomyces californicus]